jgi:hypothetical protein
MPSLNRAVRPTHILPAPVIGDGDGLTVTVVAATQPVPDKVNVIVAVPAVSPLTRPVVKPTAATVVLLLLHVPVPEPSLNVVVAPIHTDLTPLIADGSGLTVTVAVTLHPTPTE